jgi:hypothetical protein
MTHVIGDAAFVGDTLFMPDAGSARADFPGGDARTLFRSMRRIDLPWEISTSLKRSPATETAQVTRLPVFIKH